MAHTKPSVEQSWRAWMGAVQQPDLSQTLNPPASEEALSAAERALGVSLPDDFRDLYRLHDGNSALDLFGGYGFMSLKSIATSCQQIGLTREGLGEEELEEIAEEFSVTPPGAIKQNYFNPAWIPFADDGGGNFVGVDLDPGEKGARGQVINFGRDDMEMFVLAQDIAGFLEVLRQLVEGPYQRDDLVDDLRAHLYGSRKRTATVVSVEL